MAGNHEPKAEIYNGVSTLDEPSAAWGWHGIGNRAIQLAGWISVIFLLAMNFGNHRGHVETIWLNGFAVVIALGLLLLLFQPKLSQVRTLSARNKPVGHQEPDWAYDQATLSGAYADLSDSELRSLNIEPSRVADLRRLPEAEAPAAHAVTESGEHAATERH
ncbi:DUF2631 domain-containing protein [Corynebacterium frankenforstense]|uniref:DUF2631 domain-containing protein n=1 Tax=Corynebacterium frankenforstense TaxID=1230998 RepID=UPI0009FB2069|nr:DUF2631 domain-containing protein [Corynebacterium frankenforstense]